MTTKNLIVALCRSDFFLQ